jgi:probable F420-dependent oxidoreductase
MDYATIRRTAAEAEDLGVDIVFNWDHFYPLYGEPDGKHFECWTMLGAWAESTSRVEIGALVTCNSYRNPELLADMARTVDHISDGRLILGIGAGWFEKDYDQYGYDFGTPGSRLADLAQALPRIEARFAALNPPPVRKIPVLIGGGGERKTLRMVAQHADIWHSFADAETLQRKVGILRQHCADVGRDPSEIEISAGVPGGAPPAQAGPELRGLGASLFTVGLGGPEPDLSGLRAWIGWRDQLNRG